LQPPKDKHTDKPTYD